MPGRLFKGRFARDAWQAARYRSAMACALAFLLGGANAFAADGDLDPTFGVDGRLSIPWLVGTPVSDAAVAVLSQPDGKVVLVGNVNVYSGFDDQDGNPINLNGIGISRQLANGPPDPGFGTGGSGKFLIVNDVRAEHDIHAYAATLDIHGRIVIAGYDLDDNIPRQSMAIWALKADGSGLDTSFGNNGEYLYDRNVDFSTDSARAIYAPNALDIQSGSMSADSLFYSGVLHDVGGLDRAIVEGIDLSDGAWGEWFHDIVNYSAIAPNCATTADSLAFKTLTQGHILYVAGTATCGSQHRVAGSRIFDPGYNGSVFVLSFDGLSAQSAATSIAIDDLGRPVIGGYVYAADLQTPKSMAVARLTATGSFDSSFAAGGRKIIDFGSQTNMWVNVVRIQRNGSIVLGGNYMDTEGTGSAFAAFRLTRNGSADTAFGSAGYGIYTFPIGSVNSPLQRVAAMTFTQREDILLAGYVQDPSAASNNYYAVMRIRNDDTIFRNGFDP